jgi:amidase
MADRLWSMSARAAVSGLRNRDLQPADLLAALSARIDEINPTVNALPTLCFERALERTRSAAGHPAPLHGLPVPIKDSYEVEGVRTTWGSLAFKDHIATRSDYCVQAIENAGGLVYAKSNTPEFEAGASTFNEVFGHTLNPWNTTRSPAGSSGGAAVSVATGMAFIAQGSDFACSLRYPASFCGVVGLRPTPGLIPQGPSALPYQTLSVIGPLARDVADIGIALEAMAGYEQGDPRTRPDGPRPYARSALNPARPARVAYSADLGVATVADEVRSVVGQAVEKLSAAGSEVVEDHPDLSACHDAFRPLRAYQFAASWSNLAAGSKALLKPEVNWNIEQGLMLTAADLAVAERHRARARHNMLSFLDRHEFLVTPTAPVPPNPSEERFVREISGVAQETYLDWLVLGYAITITGCPAISLPCGHTADGLPIGLQIVARPHHESRLLEVAAWMEQVLGCGLTAPITPMTPARA